MELPINQPNQPNNYELSRIATFRQVAENLRIFCTIEMSLITVQQRNVFVPMFDKFVDFVLSTNNTTQMPIDDIVTIALNLDGRFKEMYEYVCRAYASYLKIKERERQFEMLNKSIETISVTTTYTPMDVDPVEYKPVIVTKRPNNIHIVIDALNWSSLMGKFINTHLDKFYYMLEDRRMKDHQLNSECDIRRIWENTAKFFQRAVPEGATIHVVVKRFGDTTFWNRFISIFKEILVDDNTVGHYYHLYHALPVLLPNGQIDTECDDRLVNKLAVVLQANNNNYVYVISNDMYRSLKEHWHYRSLYEDVLENFASQSSSGLRESRNFQSRFSEVLSVNRYMKEMPQMPIHCTDSLKYIGFTFGAIQCFDGPAALSINLDKPICA